MARKRYKTEREDYRLGGRVTLAKGGKRPAKRKKKKTVVKKAPTPKVKKSKSLLSKPTASKKAKKKTPISKIKKAPTPKVKKITPKRPKPKPISKSKPKPKPVSKPKQIQRITPKPKPKSKAKPKTTPIRDIRETRDERTRDIQVSAPSKRPRPGRRPAPIRDIRKDNRPKKQALPRLDRPEDLQQTLIRQARDFKQVGIGKGGVRQSPEERERMKAIQAQPIPEGFIRNLSTGELLPKSTGTKDRKKRQPPRPIAEKNIRQQSLKGAHKGRPKRQATEESVAQPVSPSTLQKGKRQRGKDSSNNLAADMQRGLDSQAQKYRRQTTTQPEPQAQFSAEAAPQAQFSSQQQAQTGYGSEEADTGVPDLPSNPAQPMTTPTTATAYSEEPDLSSGTDGMVNMYGDTPAYGGPTGTTAGTPETTPEPPVTTPEPPGTTPEPPVTTPEPPVTTPEEEALSPTEQVLEDSKIPDAVQAGYKRDSKGNFIIGEDGKPVLLDDDTATTIDTGTAAKAGVAGPVTIDSTATGTSATAREQDPLSAKTYQAKEVSPPVTIEGAEGTLSDDAQAKVDEIRELSGPAEAQKITDAIVNAAKAQKENRPVEDIISAGAFVPGVTGVGAQVSPTPDAEKNTRDALTGGPATGTAAQIPDIIGYEAHQRNEVKGEARTGAAATMIAQTAAIPQEIAAAIVEDPVAVEAKIDSEPVEVQAAVAALPTEALVSSQMETLVGGLESGNIPAWAKPAVDAMNQRMAERGMEVSTVGRDAMFNAIIQNALPIAQSNAQALQARAAQNLSNEQQANLAQSTQDMQRRMANLSNQQTASSQTAANAQQMATMQSQFKQEAVLTTAQQQQQTRIQNLQNLQQAAVIQSQNDQQMAMQNLGNEQQMEMANLQIESEREGANQAAINQERMAEFQVAADFLSKNAGFKQQMELANLSADQQSRLANLSAQNQASADNLNAAQQTELANLNKNMQINIRNGELANTMGVAQLNVDQQRAMQNAGMVANMDMAKFTTEQQVELANSKWMQTAGLANLNNEQQAALQNATALAALDLATVDQRTKIAAQNAQSFLQMDMANLNNDQQATILSAQQEQQRLLSNQSAVNAARQFNSASENQTNQFVASLAQQIELSNADRADRMEITNNAATNARAAAQAGIEADLAKVNAALETDINKANAELDYRRDAFNSTNSAAVKASNVAWRRNANTINTAAANTIAMQNSMNAFGLGSAELSYLWQEARDTASHVFQSKERGLDRNNALKLQVLVNDANAAVNAAGNQNTNRRDFYNRILDLWKPKDPPETDKGD
jgi:hypothetical protein